MKTFLLAWPLMLAIVVAMTMPAPTIRQLPPRKPPPHEDSWDKQVAAVRERKAWTIAIEQTPIGDEMLRELAGLELLEGLDLGQSESTINSAGMLQSLPNFRSLKLHGRPVDDAFFAEICRIPTIRQINLENADITDAGLTALQERPQLVQLRIVAPRVTDAGMLHIAALPKLRFLHLIDVPITDAGLPALAKLRQLESLYLDNAKVTDAGIERLLKQLPELHFHIDQQHAGGDPLKGTHGH